MGVRLILKKTWHFIWHEDSLLSWLVNLILAFVIVKWVVYPVIGLLLSTSYPIVAVVSGSMEHNGQTFEEWWAANGQWYEERFITQEEFSTYSFVNGFNKGDIMLLKGVGPKDIKVGDVLVYESPSHSNPIIHRIVGIEEGEQLQMITKGDNNAQADSAAVHEQQITRTGKAIFRVPWLGWIKIGFASLVGL